MAKEEMLFNGEWYTIYLTINVEPTEKQNKFIDEHRYEDDVVDKSEEVMEKCDNCHREMKDCVHVVSIDTHEIITQNTQVNIGLKTPLGKKILEQIKKQFFDKKTVCQKCLFPNL